MLVAREFFNVNNERKGIIHDARLKSSLFLHEPLINNGIPGIGAYNFELVEISRVAFFNFKISWSCLGSNIFFISILKKSLISWLQESIKLLISRGSLVKSNKNFCLLILSIIYFHFSFLMQYFSNSSLSLFPRVKRRTESV